MTNNILDVLTYMFDYLFEESEQNSTHEIDDVELKTRLSNAGFDVGGIDKALNWLENIAAIQDGKIKPFASVQNGMRIYTKAERLKLNPAARGFLLFMENIGQLSANQREMIIEQVMSLGESEIALEDLKWVIMMVLGNNGDDNIFPQWLESVVFLDDNRTLQ